MQKDFDAQLCGQAIFDCCEIAANGTAREEFVNELFILSFICDMMLKNEYRIRRV